MRILKCILYQIKPGWHCKWPISVLKMGWENNYSTPLIHSFPKCRRMEQFLHFFCKFTDQMTEHWQYQSKRLTYWLYSMHKTALLPNILQISVLETNWLIYITVLYNSQRYTKFLHQIWHMPSISLKSRCT